MKHELTKKYAAKIAALSDEHIHANGVHQISVDLVEDFEQDFIIDRYEKDDPITADELEEKCYDIALVLQIMDKQRFPKDAWIFQSMEILLTQWSEELKK